MYLFTYIFKSLALISVCLQYILRYSSTLHIHCSTLEHTFAIYSSSTFYHVIHIFYRIYSTRLHRSVVTRWFTLCLLVSPCLMSSWLSFCLPGYVMYPCTYMYIPDNWAYAYHTILLTYANLKQSSGNSSGRHPSHRTRTPWHSARQSYTSLMPKCWRRHHNYRGQCRSVGTSCVFFWVLFWGWVIVRTGNCVGTVCSFRISQNRPSTIDIWSYNLPGCWTGPNLWRLLQRIGWCVSFHVQGTCSHPPRAEKGLFFFLLPVRGFFGLRRHSLADCKRRVARKIPKSSWLCDTWKYCSNYRLSPSSYVGAAVRYSTDQISKKMWVKLLDSCVFFNFNLMHLQ